MLTLGLGKDDVIHFNSPRQSWQSDGQWGNRHSFCQTLSYLSATNIISVFCVGSQYCTENYAPETLQCSRMQEEESPAKTHTDNFELWTANRIFVRITLKIFLFIHKVSYVHICDPGREVNYLSFNIVLLLFFKFPF